MSTKRRPVKRRPGVVRPVPVTLMKSGKHKLPPEIAAELPPDVSHPVSLGDWPSVEKYLRRRGFKPTVR